MKEIFNCDTWTCATGLCDYVNHGGGKCARCGESKPSESSTFKTPEIGGIKPVDGEIDKSIMLCLVDIHDDGCYWFEAYCCGKTLSKNECNCMRVHKCLKDLSKVFDAHLKAVVREKDNEIIKLRADIAYAIGRFQGMEMDSAYLEQEYPEWQEWDLKQLNQGEK